MIKPRKLRLLIVDDELRPSLSGYMIPELLDLWYPGKGIPGITSWQTAIQFWNSFQGGVIPDLVVADVRFVNDDTSPLSRLFQYPEVNNIPTGLSHLKTFAVLARALRLPLGVGIRTMDPSLWRKQIESSRYEHKAMGLLAAHEAGELASILGDELQLGSFDDCQHIDACLEWLRNRSGTVFELGLKMALRDYRRRLYLLLTSPGDANVFVRPSHYAELMGWCHGMEAGPHPLDAQHDFGLELSYHNGKRDVISLASLFSDYDRIATSALESSSFAVDSAAGAADPEAANAGAREPWKLDDNGRPRIGAFLKPLGSLNAALNDAAEALREYQISYPLPDSYKPPTLAAIKKRSKYSSLTAALTVLLQFVRIAQKKVEEWEDRFGVYAWEPDKLQFISDPPSPDHSLLRVLQDLTSLIGATVAADDEFTIDDIFEGPDVDAGENNEPRWVKEIAVRLNGDGRPEIISGNWIRIRTDRSEQNNDWVKWHFERLIDARVLERRRVGYEDYYVLREDWRKNQLRSTPPPAPPGFPRVITAMQRLQPPCRCKKNVEEKTALPEYPTSIQWLKVSLGYNCYSDYNSVERELGAAFGFIAGPDETGTELEKSALKAKAGRVILNELEKGELPFFLAEICREYATQYLKWPREKWPRWLIE